MKLRHKPKLEYSGLTVVMDNPSRFDLSRNRLITGTAGDRFNDLLENYTTRARLDIRTKETIDEGLLPGTKGLLLLGGRTLTDWAGEDTNLSEIRGSLIINKRFPDVLTVASFLPQDTCDIVDYEAKLNKLAAPYVKDKDDDETTEKSSHGKTSRANYHFWFKNDLRKFLELGLGIRKQRRAVDSTAFNLYPPSQEVISVLSNARDKELVLDIETDCDQNITCIGLSIDPKNIMVVPLLRYDYSLPYDRLEWAKIWRALSLAMQRNLVVAHNSMFDLHVLAHRYRIGVGRHVYDTMLAHHRCYPELEKSLGHCVSLWLDEPYHKNDGVFMPWTEKQERQLWTYNAKDIATTIGVKNMIQSYAMNDSGLCESIQQANESVRPYLINTLMGVRIDEDRRRELIESNTRAMNQYLRLVRILVGYPINPSSPQQVAKYLFAEMHYSSVGRTATGALAAGAPALFKLRLKHPDNPVLELLLAIRRLAKENGQLKYNTI